MQVREFELDHGITLLAIVKIGITDGDGNKTSELEVWLHRLVVCTGKRFLTSCQHSTGASIAGGLSFHEADAKAVRHIVAMMDGKAAATLSIQDLAGVLGMCKFMLAEPLAAGLHAYLNPVLDVISTTGEVCTLMLQIVARCSCASLHLSVSAYRSR